MIDIGNIEWEKLKVVKSGRIVKLMYDNQPFSFCTSTLYSPFGVRSITKDWSTFPEYSIDCSLNQSSSESAVAFKTFLEELDTRLTTIVQENMHVFSSPKSNTDTNTSFDYQPILRENGSYPKLLRLQLKRDKNGNFTSFVFDENKNNIKIDENNIEETLVKGKTFKAIIECSKVWLYNGKVGTIWNIDQMRFDKNVVATTTEPQESPYNKLMIAD